MLKASNFLKRVCKDEPNLFENVLFDGQNNSFYVDYVEIFFNFSKNIHMINSYRKTL